MKNILLSVFIFIIAVSPQCSSHSGHDDDHSSEEISESPPSGKATLPDPSDYSILTLRRRPFAFVLRTGGRILVDSKDLLIITAKSSGLVKISDDYLFPGVKISKGQILFTVTGEQLAEDNTELNFRQIKADFDKASANFERAKKLIADKIITEEHFLSTKNEYEKSLNEYQNLNATYGKNGNIVTAADNGYIKEIYITEGQKVTSGQPLASIVIEHCHILKADVSPENLDILASVESANFTVGYSSKLYKTSEMNGRKISYGRSTGENSFYIPVYFRMDYDPELIEGTFAEVFLIGKKLNDAIVVPNIALMEEFGKLYVFVADDDGDFIKRYINAGYSDGEQTIIISGLAENEKIVTSGAYRIKLSQMARSAPAHSHNH
jgi:cobalt-zinc-cadmium efflux system membrane fusion protein